MTLAQAIEVLRRRHNAESDTFWSDNELYQLITNRCNEVLSYIGLLEDTTTVNSAASTQAYDFPSDAVAIRQINYLNIKLKQLTFAQWDRFAAENSVTSGRPRYWVKWARQYLLVPQPDTSSETITIYYYKEHPYIDGSIQTTIDIPSVLHSHLIIGVLADMFAKDQNPNMVRYYEDRWLNYSVPAFMKFKSNEDFSQFNVSIDADTDEYADTGVI